ncbi:RHS repeat-associated core domain-containing protein [Lachnospiraceae bacterium 46-61]
MNGETHKYIFDGWSITAETNRDGELKSREVRGYGLVKKETDNNQYYYHQNEHGDITHLTNTDSEIENSYQYDVFGNIREQQENVKNVFKYAGEQQDQETEQYYLRARFYNPVIARFTQEDIYRDDGLNLYVYVVNNPLLWADPSGYEKCNKNFEYSMKELNKYNDVGEDKRYNAYWKQGAEYYEMKKQPNGGKIEIITRGQNEMSTRQRLQVPPGIHSIIDVKYGEMNGNEYMYYRETIFDEFGRRIGNNDYTDYESPEIPSHVNSHYHTNTPTKPSQHGKGVVGLHTDTPNKEDKYGKYTNH